MSYMDIIKNTVKDEKVIEAFEKIDRKDFLSNKVGYMSDQDIPIPIKNGQTTSQPSLIAYMLGKLNIKPGEKVLEIGTGSGFVTALISYLVGDKGRIYAVEINPELYKFTKENLEKYPFTKNIELIFGSGYYGYDKAKPYD